MVVFDDEHQKVQLSLRQADILESLAKDEELCKRGGCVPDVQNVHRYLYHLKRPVFGTDQCWEETINYRSFTRNLAASCLNLRPENLGELVSRIYLT